MKNEKPKNTRQKKITITLKSLGPGIITGASDDDPSGIATYSQAGARFGFRLLWTAIITYPLMVSLQEMCARVGLVTGHGLAGTVKRYYPKYLQYIVLLFCIPSIILNIGADVSGMAAVSNLLLPSVPSFVFSILFTIVLAYCMIFFSYRKIFVILKWLCTALLSYILIPFLIDVKWSDVFKNTLMPSFNSSVDFFSALVGILGTTISPYLFFWQTTMEAEEIKHRHIVVDKNVIGYMKTDVSAGIFFSNIVFYFIILTTGSVLFNAGIHNIDTVEQAAAALRPLAGNMTYALFATGVIGTGLLAVPVLSGSLSYIIADTFNWEEGLDKKWWQAKKFYLAIVIILLSSLGVNFFGIGPVKALLYAAILYGLVSPVLILIILMICNNKTIMHEYTNTPWNNFLGILAFILMAASSGWLIYLLV